MGRFNEHPVMLPLDLLQPVTHQGQKIGVGSDHPPGKIELDDGLAATDCRHVAPQFMVFDLEG